MRTCVVNYDHSSKPDERLEGGHAPDGVLSRPASCVANGGAAGAEELLRNTAWVQAGDCINPWLAMRIHRGVSK